jgi:uncharacterized membrane protein YtjA (UPF0391 family)
VTGVWRWIERQGGMLVAPRRTVAALGEDDGGRDGSWALLAWLLGVHVLDAFGLIARIAALRSFDAVIGSAAELAFSLLPPFVATFVVELVLGRGRSHRAGSCLAPMLAIGTVARLGVGFGLWKPTPEWIPDVVAGAAAVALAYWVRPAVPSVRREER